MRVKFDATLNDLIDISHRVLARSRAIRTWTWPGILSSALPAGLLVFAASTGSRVTRLLTGFAAALVALLIYRLASKALVEKRIRRHCSEETGGEKSFPVTVELAELGIKVSQLQAELIYEWTTIVEIEESDNAIYFYQRDGSVVAVRKRAFDSQISKEQFLALARQYAATADFRAV